MIAAVYARKSTDQTGVADDAKSVRRQIEHATAYAQTKGWTVDDAHVYVDDGISGAEFAGRPGFVRLLNALRPRAPFQVLVMSEESRLGREAIETAMALKSIITAGVRVFTYLEDRERTLTGPMDKMLLSISAFTDELERERARQRTTDAMLRKARAGHVTGGTLFGYRNMNVLGPDGKRSHVVRQIVDAEAAVIRRIFHLCADGHGLTSIAKALNAEQAIAPRPQQGRPHAWAPSSVREVLYRTVYRGVITYNKTRKRDAWGVRTYADRDRGQWIEVPAEHLRIVPTDVWEAAQDHLAAVRRTYANTGGRPPRGASGKYLLTGLSRCGVCGGSMCIKSQKKTGQSRRFFYRCTSFHLRGAAVCRNSILVPMELADATVLDQVAALVTPARLAKAVDRAVAQAAARQKRGQAEAKQLSAEIAAIDGELQNLAAAIAGGGQLSVLLQATLEREARRTVATAQLQALGRPAIAASVLRADLGALVDDWRETLRQGVSKGREALARLLAGPVTFTPKENHRIAFGVTATPEALLGGVCKLNLVRVGTPPHFATLRSVRIVDIPKRKRAA